MGDGSIDGFCDVCAPLVEWVADGEFARAAVEYGGPAADAIRAFKYAGRSELAPVLARLAVPALSGRARELDAIVPVPLHRARLVERGYDQTELLARALGKAIGVPVRRALRRARATHTQASLPKRERVTNVDDAFVVVADVAGARLLLLDDVVTTGATLGAASKALASARAARVHSFAIARAEEPSALSGSPAGSSTGNGTTSEVSHPRTRDRVGASSAASARRAT